MGLEAFNTDREYPVGEVKARKKLDNLTIAKGDWTLIINEMEGRFPLVVARNMTDQELKAMIKFYDSQIESEDEDVEEGEYFGFDPDSEFASTVESTREDLVDILKGRKE